MHEMKCPVCNLVLKPQEFYDCYYDSEKRKEEWYGCCPKCDKEYRWTVVFTYKDIEDFGEIREDE